MRLMQSTISHVSYQTRRNLGRRSNSTRRGFTITELLVSMALIIYIMSILGEAFTSGVDTLRKLKAMGDQAESIRAATTLLRRDLAASHFDTSRTIRETFAVGAADPDDVERLTAEYESICKQAKELDDQLAQLHPKKKKAQKVLQQARDDLAEIKLNAHAMLELLPLLLTAVDDETHVPPTLLWWTDD